MIPNPLAIFGELRTQAKSIKKRYEAFQVGPEKFQSLCDELDVLLSHLDDIELLLRKYPDALPSAGATLFQEKLARVRETFKDEDEDEVKDKNTVLPAGLKKGFAGSSSSAKWRRAVWANALDDKMNALMNKIDRAANQLANLVGVLLLALKVDEQVASKTEIQANLDEVMLMLDRVAEHVAPKSEIRSNHDAVMSMLNVLGKQARENREAVISTIHKLRRLDKKECAENHNELVSTLRKMEKNATKPKKETNSSEEVYRPESNTPTLIRTVLNFSPATSLGKLKQSVLYGESSSVTAATGAVKPTPSGTSNPAYGVRGMAGVGKTVALQALGHDYEVKKRFRDGILYMTFGQKANVQTAIGQIAKIMRLTGATSTVEEVRRSTILADAVDYAVMWFREKCCLFIIDDLWPTQCSPSGYLQELRQLLRKSPSSRIVISTRSRDMAHEAGCPVDFSPRDVKDSFDIFIAHIGRRLTPQNSAAAPEGLRPSVSTILSICSGLPIALSVAGCAVSELMNWYGTFERACDKYAAELGEKEAGVGSGLEAGIVVSLEHLEVEFGKFSLEINHGILDLYTSLCVFSNQARIPLSVLSRLWNLSIPDARKVANLFVKMSLAKLEPSRSSAEDAGLVLHDLHLDFCQRRAKKTNASSFWHDQLLNGYLNQPIAEESNTPVACTILSYVPRQWWSNDDDIVPKDGYIHANLARHLSCAGLGVELAALLLDARWTELRARIGGLLTLESDFSLLGRYLSQWKGSEEVKSCIREVERSFESIFKAARLSWWRLPEGMRAFQFQVYANLQGSGESNATVDDYSKEAKCIVDAYLKSVLMTTPKPYLVPVRAFLQSSCSALITEIIERGECASVACSPCGQYIAAGAGCDIVIAKANTGDVLKRMYGHTGRVSFVKFAAGSKKIVSAAKDKKLMVWEWESSNSSVSVLQTKYFISGLAVHKNVFFSSKHRLEVWDITREESRKLYAGVYRGESVLCLDVCGKNGRVAFGVDMGGFRARLIIWDIHANAPVSETGVAHKFLTCGAFSPNGQYLATGLTDGFSSGWIELWDVSTERRRSYMTFVAAVNSVTVTSVAFSPDGTKVASSSKDGTIRLWNVESEECDGICRTTSSWVTSVSFTCDGKRIISGSKNGIIHIWDACLEKESKERDNGHTKPVRDVSISTDGSRVASASDDGTVRIWDTETGEQIGVPLRGSGRDLCSVAFSPDGGKLVSCSRDGDLMLWNAKTHTQIGEHFTGRSTASFVRTLCVSFSCDGWRIISGNSHGEVALWDTDTHEEIRYVEEMFDVSEHFVAETVDGRHVVSRDTFRGARIRNRKTMKIVWREPAKTYYKSCILDDEAENIIRSCGQYVERLWPKSFPAYTGEVYCQEGRVYSSLLEGKTTIADARGPWAYNSKRKVFAFGLASGAVAICKFIGK